MKGKVKSAYAKIGNGVSFPMRVPREVCFVLPKFQGFDLSAVLFVGWPTNKISKGFHYFCILFDKPPVVTGISQEGTNDLMFLGKGHVSKAYILSQSVLLPFFETIRPKY